MFCTLKDFLKEFFEKVNLEKSSAGDEKIHKILSKVQKIKTKKHFILSCVIQILFSMSITLPKLSVI